MDPEIKELQEKFDYLALDGSEIRELVRIPLGNMWHCLLHAKQISQAIFHKSVDEIWFILEGIIQLRIDGKENL